MMKRAMAFLLVLALVAALAGCAAKPGSAADEKVLRVGMECGYAPYNWTQSDDSNGAVPIKDSSSFANGYDVMIAKYLADKIGYSLEVQKIDWDSLPIAVQSGKIDCVIAGQSITAERLETVDFTTPYYYASIIAVTKKDGSFAGATDVAGLAGAKVTSQLNTVWYDVCAPQIPDVDLLPAMESAPAMWVALDSGKCDVVISDEPAALGAVAAYSDFVMLDLSAGDFQVSEEEINIGISLQKGNTELLGRLNKGLATLTADDFTRMMQDAIKLSAAL